jgi:hypothetical protein
MNSDYFFVPYYTCRSLVPSTHYCGQNWPSSASFNSTSYQHVIKVVVVFGLQTVLCVQEVYPKVRGQKLILRKGEAIT